MNWQNRTEVYVIKYNKVKNRLKDVIAYNMS